MIFESVQTLVDIRIESSISEFLSGVRRPLSFLPNLITDAIYLAFPHLAFCIET